MNKPAAPNNNTNPLAMVAQMQRAAMEGNLARNFGVGVVAPQVKSSACAPGQVKLANGQCGNVTPVAASKSCPAGSIEYGQKCFAVPPIPRAGAVVLARPDARGGVDFFAFARVPVNQTPMKARITRNALVYRGGVWSPTLLDEKLLSTMQIVGGQVPAGKMLVIRGSSLPNTVNQLEIVNVSGSVSGPGDAPRPLLNGEPRQAPRPIVRAKTMIAKPVKPLGAGRAEFFRRNYFGVGEARNQIDPNTLAPYQTRPGDTLMTIAKAHGVTSNELARMNPGFTLHHNMPIARGSYIYVPKPKG